MRIRFVLATGILLAASAAFAQAPAQSRVQPTAQPAASKGKDTTQARAIKPDNEVARREADERQKRWDERMRRATKSMCDRC